MSLQDLGPGISYEGVLQFAVRDYDDQVMVLDSQNQISISSTDASAAQVRGFNVQPLNDGVASFDNFIVHAEPGSSGVVLTASTKSIDQTLINDVFGNVISNNTINVDFRLCQPGEQILNNV